MTTEGFEQWFKMNKTFSAPLGDLGKSSMELFRRTIEQNLEIFGDNCSRFSDQLKRLSAVRKPEEFLTFQKDVINENMAAMTENFQKIMRITMENLEEMTKLFGALREPMIAATQKFSEKAKKFAEREEYTK